jgi:hypothetical protein
METATSIDEHLEQRLTDLEAEVARLEKSLALYKKLHNKLMHEMPERSGRYFICGELGSKDDCNLPERILICPEYGADGFAVYIKEKDYSAPEW